VGAKDNWENGVYHSQFEVLPDWQAGSAYETGDIVLHGTPALVYVAKHAIPDGTDTPSLDDWEEIPAWQKNTAYQTGNLVKYNQKVWRAVSSFTSVDSDYPNGNNWELVKRTGAGHESLVPGNEKWCAGCHDEDPANSKEDGSGVYAPNVIGEDSIYGFYVSGHGRAAIEEIGMTAIGKQCLDCHNSTFVHIDHEHRTYEISEEYPQAVIHAYKDSYRLKEDMIIPRDEESSDVSFSLCMDTCHDAHPYVFSDIEYCLTNFRDSMQYHEHHLDFPMTYWDSDWDWDNDPLGDEIADSVMSCPACHNVHGSPMDFDRTEGGTEYHPNPVMIRHGELISTPGADKVPGIDYCWFAYPVPPGPMIPSNVLLDSKKAEGDIWSTMNLCSAICHEGEYSRTPGGPEEILDMQIWTSDPTDPDNNEKTEFYPGEGIRYNLNFYLRGPFTDSPWCVQTPDSGGYNYPGDIVWTTPVDIQDYYTHLPRGEHSVQWNKTIPDGEEIPGTARFRMELQMGNFECTELLDSDTQVYDFTVVEQQP
jgi:hypothetical protein